MARASAGKQMSGSATRGRASGRTADAPWGPTEIQRDYRTLLDRAKDSPQEVLDADGELLVIQTKGVADFQRRLQAQVAETARFLAVYNEHREVQPSEWAMQTGYPWLAAFSSDEVGEFARELVADTRSTPPSGAPLGAPGGQPARDGTQLRGSMGSRTRCGRCYRRLTWTGSSRFILRRRSRSWRPRRDPRGPRAEGALLRTPQDLLHRLSRLAHAVPEPSRADAPLLHRARGQPLPFNADQPPPPAKGQAQGLLGVRGRRRRTRALQARPRRSHRRARGLRRPRPARHPLTAVHVGRSPKLHPRVGRGPGI